MYDFYQSIYIKNSRFLTFVVRTYTEIISLINRHIEDNSHLCHYYHFMLGWFPNTPKYAGLCYNPLMVCHTRLLPV